MFRVIMAAAIGLVALTSGAQSEDASAAYAGSTKPALDDCNALLDELEDFPRKPPIDISSERPRSLPQPSSIGSIRAFH